MKRVLTAVVLIPVVLLIVFKAPLWLFAVVVTGIILLALYEYLAIVEAAGIKPFHALTYAAAILPILLFLLYRIIDWQVGHRSHYFVYSDAYPFVRARGAILVLAPAIFGIPLIFRKELRGGLASAATSILGIIYIADSLSLLIALRAEPVECVLIVFLLASVWAGDIAAYYAGRAFGKHKLAPIVSPNKSWEGAIASILASVGVAVAVFHFTPQLLSFFARTLHHPFYDDATWLQSLSTYRPLNPWHVLTIGILANVAAQFGDLFESALKRGAGVKDSGTLLPGHGGILDRIDALLFAIPVVWYYAQITRFLPPF
jgi:phosphatidate cytidylyltransferase